MPNILYCDGNLNMLRNHSTEESVELLCPVPLTSTISEMRGGQRFALVSLPPSYQAVLTARGARGHQPSLAWAKLPNG